MCYKKPGPRCATHAKERMARFKSEGNEEKFIEARDEYLVSEEAILKYEEKGKLKEAEYFRRKRNQKIDAYNTTYGESVAHFPSYSSRRKRSAGQPIWSRAGIHYLTLTKYNPRGFTKDGVHKNGSKWDDEGFDSSGYHREDGFNRENNDRGGYGRDGFHSVTQMDRYGYFRNGFNKRGYNRNGFYKDGWNYQTGINLYTGTTFSPEGFDVDSYGTDGFHKDTNLDRQDYDRNGFNYWTGIHRNGVDRIAVKTAGKSSGDEASDV